jgi:hypothetical protein
MDIEPEVDGAPGQVVDSFERRGAHLVSLPARSCG